MLDSHTRVFKSLAWKTRSLGVPLNDPHRGVYKQWDKTSLQKAMCAVNEEGMSLRKASELYGIPRSTLHDKCTGKVDFEAFPGPARYLSFEEEEEFVSFLMRCADIGYGRSRKQVLSVIQGIVESKGIDTIVTNGWWERFSKRHPELTLRITAPLSRARTLASDRASIEAYFDLLEETLNEIGIFDKAAAIFNMDESGFPLAPKAPKLVIKKGVKNPVHFTGDTKSQITVLACTNAAGYALPPLVIFDRKTLNPEYTRGEVPGSIYGLSQNGWIDKQLFHDWFFQSFPFICPTDTTIVIANGWTLYSLLPRSHQRGCLTGHCDFCSSS